MSLQQLSRASQSGFITPVKRGPLPPFDTPQPPDYLPVFTKLPDNSLIPNKPQRNFPIANWFSVEVPGLPFVEGASREHPEMIQTYLLPLYPESSWRPSLIQHAKRGYSHFMLHWGVARDDAGWSIETFVEHALLVKQYIPYCHIMLYGKNEQYRDSMWSDPNGIRSVIEPVLLALIKARAVDMVAMFESNLWNTGLSLQSIIEGISSIVKPANIDQWVHFSTGVTSWGEMTRADWWRMQEGLLTGLLYQGVVDWDMGLRQEQIQLSTDKRSAMPQFSDGTFKFCAAEMDGMSIYDVNFSEDISDLHGFEHLCTPGDAAVHGVCCGGRYPNGDPFLRTLE